MIATILYTTVMLVMFVPVLFSVQNTICIKQMMETWNAHKAAAIREENTGQVAGQAETNTSNDSSVKVKENKFTNNISEVAVI